MLRTLDKRQKKGAEPPVAGIQRVTVPETPPVLQNSAPRKAAPSAPKPSKSSTSATLVTSRAIPTPSVRKSDTSKNLKKAVKNTETDDFGRIVWITDPVEGFVAARIVDISQDGFTLETLSKKEIVQRRYDDTFAAEEDFSKSVEDNCALMHLNEATLLHNCRIRYAGRKIYSYVANILISINPYQMIDGLYSSATIQSYRGKSLGQREPHIYAIADKAYREMRRHQSSQSIIVSGESGAGKTESQKAVLRYLCENWGADAGPIQRRLLETNPILEAFGNAKTLRNNNSSRFGKFVQIHFTDHGSVAGGFISHYLLETSRVCRQAHGERNYHIFYQIIAGSSSDLYSTLALAPPHKFNYLKHGSPIFISHPNQAPTRVSKDRISDPVFLKDTLVDDFSDFARLQKTLSLSGINSDEQKFIWSTIAGILHLGNVEFEENVGDSRGGCRVTPASETSLSHSSRLLGLLPEEMKMGLCARIMQTTKGGVKGTLIRVPLKAHEASAGRDALSKAIYSKLFDWIVFRVNQSIPCEKSSGYIGVLDIAGFEFFETNSFEQFLINYCNEKLQNFFNERILKQEQELYAAEGLGIQKIEFTDNLDCIELFETKSTGLFDLLDEEAKLPCPTFQHFTQKAQEAKKKSFRLDTPRKSKVKIHREMRDDEGLLIRHYAGSVCYETKYFVEKNNDELHNSLSILIEQSSFPLMVSLFSDSASSSSKTSGKLKTQSVGSKFKAQLAVLLGKLDETGTHFVRCVKPNNHMKAWEFDGAAVLSQLQCAGMPSVLRLMQEGFPSRTSFAELYKMYQKRLPPNLARLDPRLFSKCLFRALGLNQYDYQFGLTKVFFRSGKFSEFDQMMRQDPETMMELIAKVNGWLIKARWRKVQFGAWSVIKCRRKIVYRSDAATKIQAGFRGTMVRNVYRKRLQLYRKSLELLEQSKEMNVILATLNKSSQAKWSGPAAATTAALQELTTRTKNFDEDIKKATAVYEACVKRVDMMIQELKKQARSDELAEIERRRKEAEERERREAEQLAAVEKEKIARRKMEKEREQAQKEHEAQLAAQAKKDAVAREEAKQKSAREEQERLDSMVSSRLATSDGVRLVAPEPEKAEKVVPKRGKYDLSKWKYADLRDVVNTSNDMELLMACTEEFHRRLRTYNEWKAQNEAKRDQPLARAPQEFYNQQSSSTPSAPPLSDLSDHRYFKVPFPTNENKQGEWYAHFSGRYISRQITIQPPSPPQLLCSGKDDLKMCELPLEKTGLLRRKGAEITEKEFEAQWLHLGGAVNI